jgi:hypothetical protein
MKSLIKFLLLCGMSLNATDITPATNDISAFAIPKDKLSIRGTFNYLDKDIDLFNSISKSATKEYGYIGKLSGGDLSFRYGIHKHISLFYNFQALNLDYFNQDMTNVKNELFVRVNFYDVPNYIFDVFSMDVGLIRNASSDLSIKNPTSFVNLTKKIRPDIDNLNSLNGNLLYEGKAISNQIDLVNGKSLSPKLSISDLSDNSFFIRFLWGNRFSSSYFNFYTGLKYSDVSTKISYSPKSSANPSYVSLASKFGADDDLGRNEKDIFAGLNFVFETQNYIFDFNYEYDRLFGRGNLTLGDHNHNSIFDINIATKINRDFLVYIGGRAMTNQFNSVIPYMYNNYTQDTFGKRYGYVKLGFIYNFDLIGFDFNELLYFDDNENRAPTSSSYLF